MASSRYLCVVGDCQTAAAILLLCGSIRPLAQLWLLASHVCQGEAPVPAGGSQRREVAPSECCLLTRTDDICPVLLLHRTRSGACAAVSRRFLQCALKYQTSLSISHVTSPEATGYDLLHACRAASSDKLPEPQVEQRQVGKSLVHRRAH